MLTLRIFSRCHLYQNDTVVGAYADIGGRVLGGNDSIPGVLHDDSRRLEDVREGKVKAIDTMEIKPQMVQVEANPYYPKPELKKLLKESNMGIMVWYPLGHGDRALLEEPGSHPG